MISSKPGYEFAMDLLTVNVPSINESNYVLIARCTSTGWFMPPMFLELKSMATKALDKMITELRANPEYQDLGYDICKRVLCDHGGEFTGANFRELETKHSFVCIRNSPETKQGAAHQEAAVKALSIKTKSVLMENNLPLDLWETAMTSAANISNLCITAKNVKTRDGDGACPTELITNGNISRRMCRRYLSACVRIGSPCLVYDAKILGSDIIHTKLGWMVAMGSDRSMTIFMDPECPRVRVRSRSFIEHDLKQGENYLSFFDKPARAVGTSGYRVAKESKPQDNVMIISDLAEIMKQVKPKSDTYTVSHAVNAPMPTTFCVDRGTGEAWVHGNAGNLTKVDMQVGGQIDDNDLGSVTVISKHKTEWTETPDEDARSAAIKLMMTAEGAKTFCGNIIHKRYYHLTTNESLGDYMGIVRSTSVGKMGRTWKIEYTDGDTENMNMEQLLHHGVDGHVSWIDDPIKVKYSDKRVLTEAGGMIAAVNQSEAELAKFNSGPYAGVARKDVKKINIWVKRDVKWIESEMNECGGAAYTTVDGDTFNIVCDKVGVEAGDREIYLNWCGISYGKLAENQGRNSMHAQFTAPFEDGGKKHTRLRQGSKFPIPQGASWKQFTNQLRRQRDYSPQLDVQAVARAEARVFAAVHAKHKSKVWDMNGGEIVTLNTADRDHDGEPCTWRKMYDREQARSLHNSAAARAMNVTPTAYRAYFDGKVSDADVDKMTDPKTGLIMNPDCLATALSGPDGPQWKQAHDTEWGTILKMGTFSEWLTLEQIAARGVRTGRPICLRTLLDYKKGASGQLLKPKCRIVLAAHQGVCARGTEYWETFSSSPTCASERILQYLVVDKGYHRRSSDIKCAYLHGSVNVEERVCVKMDKDHRKFDENGNELYRILLGALYGHPASDRRYTIERNKFLLGDTFNNSEWKSWKTRSDGSLFCFEKRTKDKTYKPTAAAAQQSDPGVTECRTAGGGKAVGWAKEAGYTTKMTYLLIFTDDCSIVAQDDADGEFVESAIDARFGSKKADPRELLGLVRELAPDGRSMTIHMSEYIVGQREKYKEHMPKRIPKTPFPPTKFLTKLDRDPLGIEKYPDYGSLVGALLWIQRMCHPELAIGVHYLCRVMAGPNEEAWQAALYMLSWVYENRQVGIKLTRQTGGQLYAFVDASAKQDHGDRGKVAMGYIVFLGSSPIDWRTSKTPYGAQSTQHAEYMGVGGCAKATIWIRMLLGEMKQGGYTQGPTVIRCDNKAAIALVRDDIVSIGNRFYSLDCHYPKEQYENGNICVRHVDGVENCADIMTKAVDGTTFAKLAAWAKGTDERQLPAAPPPPRT